MRLLPLIAACFFIVSGGPYGLEELVAKLGYDQAILILLVTPLVWSLPTAFAVSELAAALPARGGYYAWVRRALGDFWGFQEAWLSLAASFFDMALYPTLLLAYLQQMVPSIGHLTGVAIQIGMIVFCALWNLRGVVSVGRGSVLFGIAILLPFVLLTGLGFTHAAAAAPAPAATSLLVGLLVAMWNYMGWDNACTFASEVQRPQRNYPIAILVTVALVTAVYLLPVLAARHLGLDPAGWTTGSWSSAASAVGGPWLGLAMTAGGVFCAFGMFNSLVLSYSRLPVALAEDGFLPAPFGWVDKRTGAPWFSVLFCAAAYASCLGLGFDKLVQLDILLYGLSLILELVALVALRVREPKLARPFRVPGGLAGVIGIGLLPTAVLAVAFRMSFSDPEATRLGLWLALGCVVVGPLLYVLASDRIRSPAREPT